MITCSLVGFKAKMKGKIETKDGNLCKLFGGMEFHISAIQKSIKLFLIELIWLFSVNRKNLESV
jgi:hypothetical protein